MKMFKVKSNGKINIFFSKEGADQFIARQVSKCTLTCEWINPDEIENIMKRYANA